MELKSIQSLFLLSVAVCLGCAPATEESQVAHKDLLRGTWRLVSSNGKSLVEDGIEIYWSFEEDEIVISTGGVEVVSRSKYSIDSKHAPKNIDMQIEGPPPENRLGIFEVDDNQLRMSFSLDGSPRPKKLDTDVSMVFELTTEQHP